MLITNFVFSTHLVLEIGFYKFSRKISIPQVLDGNTKVILFVGRADLNSRHKAEALRQRALRQRIGFAAGASLSKK